VPQTRNDLAPRGIRINILVGQALLFTTQLRPLLLVMSSSRTLAEEAVGIGVVGRVVAEFVIVVADAVLRNVPYFAPRAISAVRPASETVAEGARSEVVGSGSALLDDSTAVYVTIGETRAKVRGTRMRTRSVGKIT
jgi:hypothetical protein